MKIDSISINGKITAFEISEKVFSSGINNKLITQVLYSQIANSKPRLAKTKQRNEIIGSTAKIYAQKGTGNARHGSKKAPIFVGGGVAHGPKGNVYKVRKINKKEKKSSLISAISQKTKDKNLIIFEDVKDKINKTPFSPEEKIHAKIKQLALQKGLMVYPMGGTIDGKYGDHVLLAPPFIINETQIEEITEKLISSINEATHY